MNLKNFKKIYKAVMHRVCMEERTTIAIERKTLERLKGQRIVKRETHDEIINRLIDEKQK